MSEGRRVSMEVPLSVQCMHEVKSMHVKDL